MKLLAFDTSTEHLSVAVCRDDGAAAQIWHQQGAGGAQASATLIATVLALLQQAQLRLSELDAICFGSGPGSFTGLRTACAVAQGLALGAAVPVLPVNALLAVAESARHDQLAAQPHAPVMALLDARMDEIYGATFVYAHAQWTTLESAALYKPHAVWAAAQAHASVTLAGNVFATYGARLDLPASVQTIAAVPDARAMLRLAPQLLRQGLGVPPEQAMPVYVRDKVAHTTAERAALKAATEGAC